MCMWLSPVVSEKRIQATNPKYSLLRPAANKIMTIPSNQSNNIITFFKLGKNCHGKKKTKKKNLNTEQVEYNKGLISLHFSPMNPQFLSVRHQRLK